MTLLESGVQHGPLRIIIATGEEVDCYGARSLDPVWLKDVAYLINVDNENSSFATVSTASAYSIKGTRQPKTVVPKADTALTVSLSGLKGGHSAMEIDKGRCHAITALGRFLKQLAETGISFISVLGLFAIEGRLLVQ